jgi:hypothetical protein
VLPQVLTATLSDDYRVMLVAKYTNGPVKLFGGYEFIRYAPLSNPYAVGAGFNDVSGDFVCAGCAAINNTNLNSTLSALATNYSMYYGWSKVHTHN